MNNIPVAKKFLIVIGVFGVFTLCTTTFVVCQMWSISSHFRALSSGPTNAALEVNRAGRLLVKAQLSFAGVLLARNGSETAAALKGLAHVHATYAQQLDKAASDDPVNASAFENLKTAGLAAMESTCKPTLEAARGGAGAASGPDGVALYQSQCAPALDRLIQGITAKALTLTADVDARERALSQSTQTVIGLTLAIVFTGFAAVLVGAQLGVGAWIVEPIKALSAVMDRIARGDAQAVIKGTDRGDELGGMARALQVFKEAGLEKQRLESDAIAQSRLTEQERLKNEEVRARTAQDQGKVVTAIGSGLEHLSAGDLTFQITTAFAPEYEKLRSDFNAAMVKLQNTMQAVIGRAHSLRSSGHEITQSSDDLSKRTEQQAASLEEAAAALDQITATVRKTADGAVEARKVVAVARDDAEKSGSVVRNAVGAMTRIEESSRQISRIIGVIDEIAFQTNLLALNAGVEAARAGDAGKGFAVVASEVRALAQRSAEAAKEIKALISASTDQVSQGVELVGEAGRALGRIAEEVAQINGVVSEIAASAQEQATGLNEVNAAVNQMDQVTQQNAAMVEQATAAAHSLQDETDALTDLISQFRVGDMSVSAAPTRPAARRGVPIHAAPRKIAAVVGGSRGGSAMPALASGGGGWDEF